MNYYKLRIDYSSDNDLDYEVMEKKYFNNYIRVKEEPYGSNPHFHYYVETLSTEVAMRQFIRKVFGSGNGVYSLKTVTPNPIEYVAYLLKQVKTTNSLFTRGIDSEFLEECRLFDLKVKAEIQKKKEEKKPMWVQVMDYVSASLGTYHEYHSDIYTSSFRGDYRENVIALVLQFYKERNVLYRQFQIISTVETILIHTDPSYMKHLKFSILEKINK